MIHDILVHVPTERVARPVVDASVSLTAGFGAHLDAVAICYVSASDMLVMGAYGHSRLQEGILGWCDA